MPVDLDKYRHLHKVVHLAQHTGILSPEQWDFVDKAPIEMCDEIEKLRFDLGVADGLVQEQMTTLNAANRLLGEAADEAKRLDEHAAKFKEQVSVLKAELLGHTKGFRHAIEEMIDWYREYWRSSTARELTRDKLWDSQRRVVELYQAMTGYEARDLTKEAADGRQN